MMKNNKKAVLAWLLVFSMVLPLFSSAFLSYATEATITEDYDAMTIPEILEEDKSLTWVFAGDSITHNAPWSGGRNSYSEWFEQYLYDIGRGDDSVVLTAWGGASAYDFQPEGEKYIGLQSGGETYGELVGKNDPGATLEHMITKYNPDVVFIKLGFNSRSSYTENIVGSYNKMLDELYEDAAELGKKPKVVLLSPTPAVNETYYDDQVHTETRTREVLDSVKRVRDLYAGIAEERGLDFCDLRTAFIEESLRLGEDYSRTFYSDSSDGAVHPNAAGQYYLFKTLSKFIGIYDDTMPIYQLEYDDILSEAMYVDDTYIAESDFSGAYGSTSGWEAAMVENHVWAVAGAMQMAGYEGALPYRSMFRLIDNTLRYDDYRDIRMYNLASPSYTNGVADLVEKYDKITTGRDYDVFLLLPEIPEVYESSYEHSGDAVTAYQENVLELLSKNAGKTRILWTPLASGDENINGYIDDYAEAVREIAQEDDSILFYDANKFMNDKMDVNESLQRNWFEEGAYVSPICSKDVVTAFYTVLNAGDGGIDTLDSEMNVIINRNIRYSTDTQVFKGNYVRDYIEADTSVAGTTVTIDVQAIKEAYPDLQDIWFAVLPDKAAGNYHKDIRLLSDVTEIAESGDTYTFDAPCSNLYMAVYGDRAADDLIYRFKDITLTVNTDKTIPEVVVTPDGVYLDSLEVMSAPDFGFSKDTTDYTVDLYQYQTYATVRAAAQAGLTITVNGEELASGTLSQPIKVDDGSQIVVAVTDGSTTKTYTLKCAKPQQPDIIITEVMQEGYLNYAGSGTSENYELVEIYNASGRTLNLLDYSIGYKQEYTMSNISKSNNAEYPYYFTGNDQAFGGTASSGCQTTYTGIKPITKYSVYWGEEKVEPSTVEFPADSTMVIWIRNKASTDVRETLTYDTLRAALAAHGTTHTLTVNVDGEEKPVVPAEEQLVVAEVESDTKSSALTSRVKKTLDQQNPNFYLNNFTLYNDSNPSRGWLFMLKDTAEPAKNGAITEAGDDIISAAKFSRVSESGNKLSSVFSYNYDRGMSIVRNEGVIDKDVLGKGNTSDVTGYNNLTSFGAIEYWQKALDFDDENAPVIENLTEHTLSRTEGSKATISLELSDNQDVRYVEVYTRKDGAEDFTKSSKDYVLETCVTNAGVAADVRTTSYSYSIEDVEEQVEYYAKVVDGNNNVTTIGSEETPLVISAQRSVQTYTKAEASEYVGQEAPTCESEGYIFAGWYADEACQTTPIKTVAQLTEPAYALFVSEDVLQVKAQITADVSYSEQETGMADMRFLTTVDSLRYTEVGFDFEIGGEKSTKSSNTVYPRLYVLNADGKLDPVTPDYFSSLSTYFMAYTFTDIPDTDWTTKIWVRPYWKTLDGVIVYGTADYVEKTVAQGKVDSVARIDTLYFSDFSHAVQAAEDNETVELLKNATVEETLALDKKVTVTTVEGSDVTITRGAELTEAMFTVAQTGSLTIKGTENYTITVDGNKGNVTATDSMIVNAGTFTLGANASLTNAVYPGSSSNVTKGGALYNTGTATLAGTMRGNEAYYGGAIYNANGTVAITGGTFEANRATRGGVLYILENTSETTTIDGAEFNDNKVTSSSGHAYGGAIFVGVDSDVEIGLKEACHFEGNVSEYTGTATDQYGYGGCIFMATNSKAEMTVKNSTFKDNTARVAGAICVQGGSLKVNGGTYENNNANGILEDVRCQNATTVTLFGLVDLYVGLNNTSKILINEELHADSKVYIRIVNASSLANGKTRDVVEFTEGLMTEASKNNFEVHPTQIGTYTMTFGNNVITMAEDTTPEGTVAMIGTNTYESLADAIAAANALDSATIVLKADVTVDATQTITGNVTITDDGTKRTITRGTGFTVDGYNAEMFHVDENAELTFTSTSDDSNPKLVIDGNKDNVTMATGVYAPVVRLYRTNGILNITKGVVIQNNQSGNTGGIIYAGANKSNASGGGLATISITGGLFKDNEVVYSTSQYLFGGCIYIENGCTLDISDATFDNTVMQNTQSKGLAYGGIVAVRTNANQTYSDQGANVTIDNCIFKNTTVTQNNGGNSGSVLYIGDGNDGNVQVSNCEFTGNTTQGLGGAICMLNKKSPLELSNCSFSNNTDQNGTNDIYMAASTTVNVADKIQAHIYCAGKQQIHITENFNTESVITVELSSATAGATVATFASEAIMNACQTNGSIVLSDTGYALSYDTTNLNATLVAAQ